MKINLDRLPADMASFIAGCFLWGERPEAIDSEMEVERVITKLSSFPHPTSITSIAIGHMSRLQKKKLHGFKSRNFAIVPYSQVPDDIRRMLKVSKGIGVNFQGEVLVDDLVVWLEEMVKLTGQPTATYKRLNLYLNQLDRIKFFNSLKGKKKPSKMEDCHDRAV